MVVPAFSSGKGRYLTITNRDGGVTRDDIRPLDRPRNALSSFEQSARYSYRYCNGRVFS